VKLQYSNILVINVSLVILSALPGAPASLTVKDKKENYVTLTWKAPKSDGGAKIEAYHILVKEGDKDWKDVSKVKAYDSEFKVEKLTADIKYLFAVLAENSVGKGPAEETSLPVVLKKRAKKPSTPKGPITFSDINRSSVTVAWQPPKDDGGAPIKEYTLEAKEKSKASWNKVTKVNGDITSYCAQNLKDKQEYIFRVTAENEVGQSESLVSETVTLKSQFGKSNLIHLHAITSKAFAFKC